MRSKRRILTAVAVTALLSPMAFATRAAAHHKGHKPKPPPQFGWGTLTSVGNGTARITGLPVDWWGIPFNAKKTLIGTGGGAAIYQWYTLCEKRSTYCSGAGQPGWQLIRQGWTWIPVSASLLRKSDRVVVMFSCSVRTASSRAGSRKAIPLGTLYDVS